MGIESIHEVSLLWPNLDARNKYSGETRISERSAADLGVDHMVRALSVDMRFSEQTKLLLLNLCDEAEVLRFRLDVLEDFMDSPDLAADFYALLPSIRKLDSYKDGRTMQGAEQIRKVAWQLEVLRLYLKCVNEMKSALNRPGLILKSEGLLRLRRFVAELTEQDAYRSLEGKLPEFRTMIDNMSSVTIGINLDPELKAEEAVFLTVEPKPFREKKHSIVSSLLGLKSVTEEFEGVSLFQNIVRVNTTPMMKALSKCLDEVLEASIEPIVKALQRYIYLYTDFLIELEFDLAFYIGAERFLRKLTTAGLPVCKPVIAGMEERRYQVDHLYDALLANGKMQMLSDADLSAAIIGNEVDFGTGGKLFILTGPNQGGKTTYTRAIGLAQLMFQAGLFVPGHSAILSPTEWIFTHFSEEEKPNAANGRLAEESRKLSEIFERAAPGSILLLNESLSSTSPRDSYLLARDLAKGIKLIGCRAVFATHILELASSVDSINRELPGESQLVSMVAGVEQCSDQREKDSLSKSRRTYKVYASPPSDMSYAHDIAKEHGILFEQVAARLEAAKYLTRKYPNVKFKTGSPGMSSQVPVEASVGDERVKFQVFLNPRGIAESDNFLGKRVEAEAKTAMEKVVSEIDSSMKIGIQSFDLKYDPNTSEILNYTTSLEGSMAVSVEWKMKFLMITDHFMDKSIVVAKRLVEHHFQIERFVFNVSLENGKQFRLELERDELTLPKNQLLNKIEMIY
jgi:hypothetical protein